MLKTELRLHSRLGELTAEHLIDGSLLQAAHHLGRMLAQLVPLGDVLGLVEVAQAAVTLALLANMAFDRREGIE